MREYLEEQNLLNKRAGMKSRDIDVLMDSDAEPQSAEEIEKKLDRMMQRVSGG